MSLRTEQDKYISHITVLLELNRENNNGSVSPSEKDSSAMESCSVLEIPLLSCESLIQE